jgi:thiamine biosynthesis lipoprotein
MTGTPVPLADARFFAHEAMKTTFTLRFQGLDDASAKGMARECFELIDRIESRLSRFVEGSEIWQINHLSAGETLYLSDACHRCLIAALEAWSATGGLFDVTLGSRIEHAKSGAEGDAPAIIGKLVVHPDVPAVTCEEPGRVIDLGGIGKGFALDETAALLTEWEVPGALLCAGASSMRAIGGEEWPVDLTGDHGSVRIGLCKASLSASGTGIQGQHIIHPGGGDFMPERTSARVWVTAETAALAEVWSTAMMLVSPDEMRSWLGEAPEIRRMFAEGPEGIVEIMRA